MRPKTFIGTLVLALASLTPSWGEDPAAQAPAPEKPGDVERAAMTKVDFLVGDWEGEGWSVRPSGERTRFWVKEFYHYRGDHDLMDMEGRFGDILADGTRATQREFGLGFLYFDRASGEYRMWHYSSDGTAFTVTMEVDPTARSMQYTRTNDRGTTYTFALIIDTDGVWTSRITVIQPDGSRREVAEFRMTRTDSSN